MSGVRVPIEIRLWPKVNKDGPVSVLRPELGKCWLWSASKQGNGYGKFAAGGRGGKWLAAHRVVYEVLIAPIEPGLELDHLCKVILCVNPDHLEPVTPRENKLRGTSPAAIHAKKTHCPEGHPYDEQNTRWNKNMRHCRLCAIYYQRALRARRRLEKCV
jgi:hypothetical protein